MRLVVQRLLSALWLGSAFFLMLAASAAFRAAPNPTAAADVVGAMLSRWHYIALAAPLLLFALELRRPRRLVLIAVFTGLLLAAGQVFVDLRIRSIRQHSPAPISSLDRNDPLRRHFGALHGVSMLLLLLQALSAAAVVAAPPMMKKEEVAMPMDADEIWKVVVNDEGEYSIAPAGELLEPGWKEAGFSGSREQCLMHIFDKRTRR
jgi:uncharacterized protein YbdZ (MbtH family)